jgi:hypothetical protein
MTPHLRSISWLHLSGCIFFSDVSLRYSLGPNPRGVTEYGFHRTLVTMV